MKVQFLTLYKKITSLKIYQEINHFLGPPLFQPLNVIFAPFFLGSTATQPHSPWPPKVAFGARTARDFAKELTTNPESWRNQAKTVDRKPTAVELNKRRTKDKYIDIYNMQLNHLHQVIRHVQRHPIAPWFLWYFGSRRGPFSCAINWLSWPFDPSPALAK